MEVWYEREAGTLPSHFVRAPDGSWTASIPGLAPPAVATVKERSLVFVDSAIGSSQPVACQVYDGELEIAGTIQQVLGMAPQHIQVDSIVPWSVTIDNGHPAAWIEAFYLVDRAQGRAGGHLKLAISARDDHPLLCFHDEVGYRKTFRHIAQGFFQSFEPSQKSAEPHYLEVAIRYADEVPIGFKKSVLTEEEEIEGYQRWTTKAMLMLPVGEAKLLLKEEYEVLILDTTKHVAFGRWMNILGGDLTLDLELARVEGNLYQYNGQFQGAPVRGEFRTVAPRGLSSALSTAGILAKHLVRSKGFSFVQDEYVPAVDPTAPQRVTYYRNAEDLPRVVRWKAGDSETLRVVDEHGMLAKESVQLGASRFSARRELRKGKL